MNAIVLIPDRGQGSRVTEAPLESFPLSTLFSLSLSDWDKGQEKEWDRRRQILFRARLHRR
jgi:hypothetical protein